MTIKVSQKRSTFFQIGRIHCPLPNCKWLDMLCWALTLTSFSLQVGLVVEFWNPEVSGLKFHHSQRIFLKSKIKKFFCQLPFGKRFQLSKMSFVFCILMYFLHFLGWMHPNYSSRAWFPSKDSFRIYPSLTSVDEAREQRFLPNTSFPSEQWWVLHFLLKL